MSNTGTDLLAMAFRWIHPYVQPTHHCPDKRTPWLDNLLGMCNARIEAYDFKIDLEKYEEYKKQHRVFFEQFKSQALPETASQDKEQSTEGSTTPTTGNPPTA